MSLIIGIEGSFSESMIDHSQFIFGQPRVDPLLQILSS
jgi:hypothetical protein